MEFIPFIPLISQSESGPLGLLHLPRFWLKMRARAVDVLPDGYRCGNGGSDEGLVDAIGIDGKAFAAFIAREAPDYQACESWIRTNARNLNAETIRAFNAHTVGFDMPDPRRTEWSERFGLTDPGYMKAFQLNHLDDWDGIHHLLLEDEQPETQLVPAISSSVTGPLSVVHLPRLWLKHRLHGVGRLMDGYRHGAGGFDEMMTTAIGLDPVAFADYVEAEKPAYLEAEAWVREHATSLTPDAIAAWATTLATFHFPAARVPERHAELGITDPSFTLGVPLNDLDDWAGLHRQLLATN
jgi:hypothetical protein